MKLSRFCSIVLTVVTIWTAISSNCVLAYNDMNETDMVIRTQGYSADTLSLAEFNDEESISTYLSEHTTCSYENNAAHMYNGAMKFASEANGEQSYMRMEGLSIDFSSDEYKDYEYLNFWMYVPEILPVNEDDEPSELSVILRTGAGTNVRAFYYNLPVDKSGWNLVSIPRNEMKNKTASANWDNASEIVELLFYMNPKKAVLPNVSAWPEDGSGYIMVDYIYLSKLIPDVTSFNFIQTSIENGANDIDEYLGGDKTIEFIADNALLESSLKKDKCTITENGDVMSGGYEVYVEGNKVKVTFDDKLKTAGKYVITLNEDIVYSQYGITNDNSYSVEFNIASASSVYKIDNVFPENGAEAVPLDIDGNNTVTIAMNNEPGSVEDLKKDIRITKNNFIISDGYSVEVDDKNIYVKFNNRLEANVKYTIKLPDYIEDIYGNGLSGNTAVSFSTEQSTDSVTTLLSMGDPSTYSNLSLGDMVYKETENARSYEETLHYTIPAVNTADFYVPVTVDMSQYKYLNFWLYSPGISNSGFTITGWDNSGGYFRTHKAVDWSGWQLITFNIADFATGGSGTPQWENVNSIGISVNGWTGYISPWSQESYLCIDDIFLSKITMEEPKLLGTSLPGNYQNASVIDFNVDFVCSNALGNVNKSKIKIYDSSDNEIENFDATIIDSRLNVKINQQLEYNTAYKIVLPDDSVLDKTGVQLTQSVTYTFKTMAPGLSIGIPVFKQGDIISEIPDKGSEVMASVLVSNDGADAKDVMIAAVQYDIEGNIIDIHKQKQTVASGNTNVDLKCDFTVEDNTEKMVAFVCDANMQPLRREAAYLNGTYSIAKFYTAGESASSALNIGNAELNNREISITGKYNGSGIVLARITDSVGNDIYLDILSVDENNGFGTIYNLDKNTAEGEYIVTVSAFDANPASKKVVYLNDSSREAILNKVNDVKSLTEMTKILNEYKAVWQVEELPQPRLTNIVHTLYEQKPYKSYSKLLETIKNADLLLERLNNLQWSEMSAFLSEYQNIVMYDEKAYSYYRSLSNSKKNLINTDIVKHMPQSDFVSFRHTFANIVDDYQSNLSQSGTSGGTGGSGGGAGGTGTYVGGIGGINNPFMPAATNQPTNPTDVIDIQFSDMNDYLWAKAYVDKLLKKNVISMSDDRLFRPGDNITREEYVKMIVIAFGLPIDSQESKYIDAVSGAWYQPYLVAATKSGIIEGKDDGTFGVGQSITRQDMAVIAYRAVGLTNEKLPVKNEVILFEDNSEISDYAAESVAEMSAAGIIHGMDNSKFEPFAKAQRAQAAKIISELVDWRDNV